MTEFEIAMSTENIRTENGMLTNSTSLSALLDAFFQLPAARQRGVEEKIDLFHRAFMEAPLLAMKLLFYVRDIRGGQGERKTFRDILGYLCEAHPDVVNTNVENIPLYGRWDDVLVLLDHDETRFPALVAIATALGNKNGLCAKWMPRKGRYANIIRKALDCTPKEYRKLIVGLSQTVEQQMCAGEWDKIDYSAVPSVAAKNYRRAFGRHSQEAYAAYLAALEAGDPSVKVNASAIFPHDIITPYLKDSFWGLSSTGEDPLLEQQWKALPDWYDATTERILPVCDVSGSMFCNENLPIRVSLALGCYLAERNPGPFKDLVMTFSLKPQFLRLSGSLRDRVKHICGTDVGYNTNMIAVFDKLLQQATRHSIAQDEMPSMILLISDMEFDRANAGRYDATAIQAIEYRYREAGYEMPKVVFWNVNARNTNVPVRADKNGTALVSGASPAIVKALLNNPQSITPLGIMLKAITADRYESVVMP